MKRKLLHVFRNTPLGRETLLQSAWFCKQLGCDLAVYVPRHPELLLHLENRVATVSLDSTYLRSPDTAVGHVRAIASEVDLKVELVEPDGFTAPTLPNLSSNYAFMTCPRSMSELSNRIRLGHIGPRVRVIVNQAPFPVLLPTPVYKPWRSVVACFGGSENSIRALRLARRISSEAGAPLSIFTWSGGLERASFEASLEEAGLAAAVQAGEVPWNLSGAATLAEALYDISRDALVVAGAYGHGAVREAFFGSKPETIQAEVPNNLMLVGPAVRAGLE